MQYHKINGTDLNASGICLGTVHYGTACPQSNAFEQLDYFCEHGGNFIDTAHVYGDWVVGEGARSEKVIGAWLKQSGRRQDVIVSTKGGHPLLTAPEASRITVRDVTDDLENSLRNLRTNYIDVYFLHRDCPDVAIEVLISLMEKFVKEGKIRYYGCSNWSIDRIAQAQSFARENNARGFVFNQIMDCLAMANKAYLTNANMSFVDQTYYNYHAQSGLSVMAYMAVSLGYFPKRFAGKQVSDTALELCQNEVNETILLLLKRALGSAEEVLAFALSYVMARPYTSIPMASFSRLDQMPAAMESCDLPWNDRLLDEVRAIKGW